MFEISIWCTSSVTMIYWNTDLSYENWKPFYFLFGKTKNKTDVSVNQIIMIFKSNSKGFRFVFLKKSYFYMKLKVTINNSKIWSDPSFPMLNVISLFMNDSPRKTCFKSYLPCVQFLRSVSPPQPRDPGESRLTILWLCGWLSLLSLQKGGSNKYQKFLRFC